MHLMEMMKMTAEGQKTIKVISKRFGELEVNADVVINIIGGIIGFGKMQGFIMLDYQPPFSWLQSTEAPELAFVVINSAEFGENYSFKIPYDDSDLALQESTEIAIFNIATIRPDPSLSTVNLKAPVIVNLETRQAKQIILDDPRFPTRMPLWDPNEEKAEEAKEEPKKE
jgi:flagellar assembly factor FliW